MKYALEAGRLTITAESSPEVKEMIDHFKLDAMTHVDNLVTGTLTHTVGTDKRPYFAVSETLGANWLEPYYAILERVTGYTGRGFTIEQAPKYGDSYAINLQYTHIVETARITPEGYHFAGYIASEDWDGKRAEDRAPRQFAEYVRDGIGFTKHEPELIETGFGVYRRNPNYMKHHAPKPAASSSKVFKCLFDHWLAHHATEGQKALWSQGEECYRTISKREPLAHAIMRGYGDGFHADNYKRLVTFDEFKAA